MIVEELPWRAPRAVFRPLASAPYAALLCSGAAAEDSAWAFIACDPVMRVEAKGAHVYVDGAPAAGALSGLGPFDVLAAIQRMRSWDGFCSHANASPPLASGLVGFAGYELGGGLEPKGAGPASPFALPDMAFGVYDAIAAFDLKAKRFFITGRTNGAVEQLSLKVLAASPLGEAAPPPSFAFSGSNFTRRAYEAAVSAVREQILNGDYYQANLAQHLLFEADAAFDPYMVFDRLMEKSASAFGAYLNHEDGAILSNSPERFFNISRDQNGLRIFADPIKGTRPRAGDPLADKALADALQNDAKDRAENIMIADLLRNDLSAICADHSVKEDFICRLFSYQMVHHLVSRISGRLREGATAADALKRLFPCGSITGAPKIEAMRAIGALEGVGRGPYCGAIGYLDDRGGAEFSVAIRTMITNAARRRLTAPVGGGITLRSDPAGEYEETLVKAAAFFKVLGVSGETREAVLAGDA